MDADKREQRIARCIWELYKHSTGDPRANGTVTEWLAELEALEGDDLVSGNGPN